MEYETIELTEEDYFPDYIAKLDVRKLVDFLYVRNLIDVEDIGMREFDILGCSRPGRYNCFIFLRGGEIFYSFLFNLNFRTSPKDTLIEFIEDGDRTIHLVLSKTLEEIEAVISSLSFERYEIEMGSTAQTLDLQTQYTSFRPLAEGSLSISKLCMTADVDSTRIYIDRRPAPNRESYGMSILVGGKRYFIVTVMPFKSLHSG